MARREVTIVVLCEDDLHERCAKRFLKKLSFEPRKIRVVRGLAGRGAASRFVLSQAHNEASEVRRRRNQGHQAALVIVIDGDESGFAQRKRQVEDAIGRERSEPIAIFVPTWSIETWVLALRGDRVDESESCKLELRDPNPREFADLAHARWLLGRQGRETDCPPAMADAVGELGRLPL